MEWGRWLREERTYCATMKSWVQIPSWAPSPNKKSLVLWQVSLTSGLILGTKTGGPWGFLVSQNRKLQVQRETISQNKVESGVEAQSFNSSTWETKVGTFLSLRAVWSTCLVPGQPGLYIKTVSENKQTKYVENNKDTQHLQPLALFACMDKYTCIHAYTNTNIHSHTPPMHPHK